MMEAYPSMDFVGRRFRKWVERSEPDKIIFMRYVVITTDSSHIFLD